MDVTPDPSAEAGRRFTVSIRFGEPSVLSVAGETDLESTGPLREAVRAALEHHPHLVFDLSGVAFADSTFLNVLLEARNAAAERDGSVRLQNAGTAVQRLLDVTGAARLFTPVAGEQA